MKLPHWPVPYGKKAIDLGLSRIKKMLSKIGNPHLKLPPVIHVAGTNGKGSTIAYLKAILELAGYKVHQYISPHLVRFNERIMLAGQEIEDDFLTEITEECCVAARDMQLTFFEGTTAAAFLAFSRVKADILLLETGLGGRLDATNVIDNPLMSVITPISLDHVEYLGNTVAFIAKEKAGIIKKNCVISWQLSEAMEVLVQECERVGANYYAWGKHWDFSGDQNHFLFNSNGLTLEFPIPSLYGLHQIVNAATAIAAVNLLNDFNISKQHIDYGLTHTVWPARLQKITSGVLFEMLEAGSEMWLDGAHNIGGAQMLIASIENMQEKLPLYLINGRSKDWDIAGFLECFKDRTAFFCATYVKSEPLSESSEKIHQVAVEMGFKAECSESIRQAVEKCLMYANGKRVRILICGSLYLSGDVLAVNQGII
ncbi:MAG: bifunctional folylpolyglutamate synthase/dihydrofolate synthase [Candidatus Midichloria sp.]|nr:MAG: bifunctional folylpolyglutamate synthase/dihydrofolate synthase [Candidatus Midichloria sp.]